MFGRFKKFIPKFILNWYHFLLSFLGAVWYGFPSKEIVVIGVTGTKGKSTVVNLAGRILEETYGGKVGWVSSLTLKIGDKETLNPFHMTMPGRFFLQKSLRDMVKKGCKYALIEATSEGISQNRHKFIDFNAAALTNLAPEHIEAHGNFENYKKAKGELFKAAKKIHIININDETAEYFLRFPAEKKYLYKIKNQSANWRTKKITNKNSKLIEAEGCQVLPDGLKFLIDNTEFRLRLLGEFNIYNSLAAICIGLAFGSNLEFCKKALEKIKTIPGRLETINEGQNFKVIVDLAHTPDSFDKIFELAKSLPHKKIISVFGSAGGGRDKWKRQELGKIAAKYSDYIVITNEDSYDESPEEILSHIKRGILAAEFPLSDLFEIVDRRAAIKKAVDLARVDDIVLILGKGTEQLMITGSEKIKWDDRQAVREEIGKLRQK